ncbi:YybH family protein [Aliiruegeria sabulilitoris]|uniref:YybH family protein n=1 Tax=Aliiruegeria sabulilitoris TaxID=1510458 RepID=UPI0013D569B9|nr:nuclear transport factor 2 family protein [Aliiruegeria sabulilitoris]
MGPGTIRILAAGAIALACAIPVTAAADMAADEAAILDIWSSYSAARVAGDAESWLNLWDKEGIRMPPGVPAVDFATFAPGTPERFANAPASMEIKAEEVMILGDYAYSRGTFTVNNAVEGKFLTIFRRQEDGTWRIYRDAFSMNAE